MANVSSSNGLEKYPKLRFPEFDEPYRAVKLGQISSLIKRNDPRSNAPIMMLSAGNGFIMQSDKYSRDNAGQSLKKYTLLKKGELAYNHGASKAKQFGCCYELLEEEARIPYVYHCFKVQDTEYTPYVALELNNTKMDKQLKRLVSSSVRMDGLLNISYDEYMSVVIYLPAYAEQKHIADFLEKLDMRIAKQEQLIEALKKYKRGLLRNVFDKSIKTANYQKIYWTEAKLGEICTYRRGSFPQPYGLSVWYDEKNGMPFIQVTDVNDNMTINSDTNRHISDIAKSRSVFIPKGTLIVTLQGTIGRVAITSYDAYIDRTLLIIQNISDCVLKEFLMYAIYMKFDIEKQTADGSIIKTITKETFTEFTIHIPPIYEQQKIVNLLRSLDQRMGNSKEVLEKLGKMRSSLLQQLFI